MGTATSMASKPTRISSSQPDIKVIALAETPAVSLHIVTEIELGYFSAHGARGCLFQIHLKFDLLSNHWLPDFRFEEISSNRAEVDACTDQHSGPNHTIDDPCIVGPLNTSDLCLLLAASATAFQQVLVKLTAADTVTDNLTEADINSAFPDAADAKSSYGLQNSCPTIFLRTDFEHLEHGRRDPASTNLVPGKLAFLEDQHLQPCTPLSPATAEPPQ